jgi:hypothetical protein
MNENNENATTPKSEINATMAFIPSLYNIKKQYDTTFNSWSDWKIIKRK